MKPINKKFKPNTLIIISSLVLFGCGGGGGSDEKPTTTPPPIQQPDKTPDSFSFTDVTNAELSALVTSERITISGIDSATPISISSGEYSINSGTFTSSDGEINNSDTVTVRLTSADAFNTTTQATLTIGGVSDTFSITTQTEPVIPPSTGVNLDFNLNIKHQVGGLSEFDRKKFITIHASHTENDWYSVGTNASADLITEFVEGYDVYFGRDTGGMAWQLSQLPESPSKSGWVDELAATEKAGGTRWNYTNDNSAKGVSKRKHEHRNTQMIVGAQQRPYFPDGTPTKMGWAFSQTDTAQEPFGSATGNYMGQYIAKYFNKGNGIDTLGQPKPKYVEVMNEPLWELVEHAENPTTVETVFHFHNAVANAIRDVEIDGNKPNANALIGGYTAAFPDFDKNNFQQWLDRDKKFIDIAGDNMDFLSIHLYDFPIIGGKKKIRSGSNMEATLDLLTSYSQEKLGEPLPFIISEYGGQIHDMFNQPWSAERDWYILASLNSQLMAFLERPDQIEMVVPFITVKAEWGRINSNIPYYHRLMRQKKEGIGETGEEWVYTELVKFYQLWANVNGTRIESYSSDQDVQIDGYVDGDKAYLIINNLEAQATTVNLNTFGIDNNAITNVITKHLYLDGQQPMIAEETATTLASSFELGADATAVFEITLADSISISHSATETKYFNQSDLININANQTISFAINNVDVSDNGMAMLRLGISRDHGLSLTPEVVINNTAVSVPVDYRGYDQFNNGRGRDNFYGVIEIPIDVSELSTNNEIKVTFPDSGGVIASKGLQVINSTTPLGRTVQ